MDVGALNIDDCSIEIFAQLIIDKTTTFTHLKKEIYSSELNRGEINTLINRLNIANKRVHENLAYDAILFYTLIPSRKLHGFSKKYYLDTDKQLKQGYRRKCNQYYIFSILGHSLYVVLIVLLMLINF